MNAERIHIKHSLTKENYEHTSKISLCKLTRVDENNFKNGIGMDDYLDRFFNSYETATNYPPYNLIHVNNVESVLEIALAGFGKKELKVYTEYGKLIVEGSKETKDTGSEYVHQGLAQRSFTREWALSEDVEVREVQFKDGLLTVKLGKVVPEHHARKDYLK